MMSDRFRRFAAFVLTVFACIPAFSAELPDSMLFIGNSYTFFNSGVNVHLERLAAAADSAKSITTSRAVEGGYTLQMHFQNNAQIGAIDSIYAGNDDVVVLQGYWSHKAKIKSFCTYARLFDRIIGTEGAQTVFYMTWSNPYDTDVTNAEIAHVYDSMAVELDARVAHVGLAFDTYLKTHGVTDLYSDTLAHPHLNGTYLAACCFYARLSGRSPVGIPYNPDPQKLSAADILELQTIAWKTEQAASAIAPAGRGAAGRNFIVTGANPFAGTFIVRGSDAFRRGASLRIFDTLGNVVFNAGIATGNKNAAWYGKDGTGAPVPPGMYYYRLLDGNSRAEGTILLRK